MFDMKTKTVHYKRARFASHLPTGRYYTAGHYWMAPDTEKENLWYIGYTKFATRMLGDIVEFDFECEKDALIKVGEIIGWIEGFKATSDIYSVVNGTFLSANPALEEDPDLMRKQPYGQGWLFSASGNLDPDKMELEDYSKVLDTTIDRILEGENH